jgi:Mrp family chromosome partitioning ATPase
LVAVFLVLGTAAGWASAAFATEQPLEPVYVATHMLQVERNNPNLQQLAILTTSGEIPNRVADRLGGSGTLLATQVKARPITPAGLLQIIAVGQDPERVVLLADTFAEELVRYESEAPPNPEAQKRIAELEARNGELARLWGESLACMESPASSTAFERCKTDYEKSLSEKKANDAEIERLKNPQSREPSLVTVNSAEAIPVAPATAEKILNDSGSTASGKNAANAANSPVIVTPAHHLTNRPDPLTRSGAGAALGLLLGAGLALTIDRIDPRIRTKLDAEEAFGWPVVAEVPVFTKRQRSDGQVVSYTFPRSRVAEAFRALRTTLLFSDIGRMTPSGMAPIKPTAARTSTDAYEARESTERKPPAPVVLVTSPGPSEGKTTTVANLAAVFAEADYKVFVLNCDFRRPQMHRNLGTADVAGEIVDTAIPGVSLVNHVLKDESNANPADVLAAQREFIRSARDNFDVILLDTAPLLATNDAADILPEADQVILVGRAGRTTKEAADRAAELLDRRKAPIVGVVLTAASEGVGGRYYYYYGVKSYYLDDQQASYTDDRSRPYTDESPRRHKRPYTDERRRRRKGRYTDERAMRSPLATLAEPPVTETSTDDASGDPELQAAASALNEAALTIADTAGLDGATSDPADPGHEPSSDRSA